MQAGGTVSPSYSQRELKFYNVEETELVALTALDAVASVFLSILFSSLTFVVGANWDLLLTSDLPDAVLSEARSSRNFAGFVAIGALTLLVASVFARATITGHIKRSSKFVKV